MAAPTDPIDPAVHAPLSVAARPELTGGKRIGVLLSHGFTGSPYSMVDWGRALADLGYGVEVPCLPGHGRTWQEMNRTGWSDWYGEVSRVFAKLQAENDVIVLCGFSMGGGLVLQLAADHADAVAGVVLLNPAVATKRRDILLLPITKHLIGSFPGIASDIKKEGVVEYGYDRTPLKAAHSMFRAWPSLVADLPKVTAPILYLRSTVDHVVDEASEPVITSRVSGPVTVRRLENSYHVATLDYDAQIIIDESAAFIAKVTSA
jgi:carboxylesterase